MGGTQKPIRNLCYFYLNIGWLGVPVATSLFGNGTASLFIAAYIGSTIFGNSVGLNMLGHGISFRERCLKLLKSPTVIVVIVGIALIPVGDNIAQYLYRFIIFISAKSGHLM